MDGGIDATSLEVETNRIGHLAVEGLLPFDGIMARQTAAIVGWTRSRRINDGQQGGAETPQGADEPPRRRSAFETIDEGIVKLIVVAPSFGVLSGKIDKLLEMGGKAPEIRHLPGLGPSRLGMHPGFGEFLHEFRRQAGGAIILVPPFAAVRSRHHVARFRLVLRFGDPFAHFRRREPFVHVAAEPRHLLGSIRDTAGRKEHLLIPAEERGGVADELEFLAKGSQPFVGGDHGLG